MLKWHKVTLHHVITVYIDMFQHMDGIMWALTKKQTRWNEDLEYAVKFAWPKLSKCYREVTPTAGMLRISALILDRFQMLWSFTKWDKVMDMNPEDETSYTTQYQEALLKYVEKKYCAKHLPMSVIKPENVLGSNCFPTPKACGFGKSSFDPYDWSSNDEEYLTAKSVAEMTTRWSDCAAHLLTATTIWIHSLNHERTGGKLIEI